MVPVNFALSILGNIYQAVLAFDALRSKNNLQLYSICVIDACLFVFSIMCYRQTSRTVASLQLGEALGERPFTDRSIDFWKFVQPALLASSAIIALCFIIACVLVYLLQREYRWVIYRHISGSLGMLRRYFAYQVGFSKLARNQGSSTPQVLLVLLRIETYFLVGFVIVYGLIDVHYEQPEFSLTFAITPVLLIQVAMTIVFTKSENMIGAIAAIVRSLYP